MDDRRWVIWIADDSAVSREQVAAMLYDDYELELFSDGVEVIERLATGSRPDLLIVDWVMPAVTGLEVIDFVRARPATRELPVIIVTATGDADGLARALHAGADDFIHKPCAEVEVRARVARLLRRQAERDAHTRTNDALLKRESGRLAKAEHARATAEEGRAASDELARLAGLFMGIVGHDLRSPLASISITASLMAKESATTEKRVQLAARVQHSVKRMNEMIGQLLDLTRSRSEGGIRIEVARHDALTICEQVVAELRAARPERCLELTSSGETVTMLDPWRLGQVVSNLVSNALQHGATDTPVHISVDGTSVGIDIAVENQGEMIAPALQASMFDPYRRAARKTVNATDGVGLGLYISNELIRAHGGTIGIQSNVDGTVFTAHLPRIAVDAGNVGR